MRTLRILFSLAVVLPLSACVGIPNMTNPSGGGGSPGPAQTSLMLDFGVITAIRDCDSVGPGDFRFRVTATSSPNSGSSGTVLSRSMELGRGQNSGDIGLRQFQLPAQDGATITVRFSASEVDDPPIGQPRNDNRMDNLSGESVHVYRNGRWTNMGGNTITLGGGVCQVRLQYTAS